MHILNSKVYILLISILFILYIVCSYCQAVELGIDSFSIAIPLEPDIPPAIVAPTDLDTNLNGIDDNLENRLQKIESDLAIETDPAKKEELEKQLQERVKVQVIFSRQIIQEQVDDFYSIGGDITYIFSHISYGWIGNFPIGNIRKVPLEMRESFVAILAADYPLILHLDEATRNGRVRTIWSPGFAGSTSGLSGSSNITIAFADTGIDDSHADLFGRQEYWHD